MKVSAGLFHTPAEPRRGGLQCNICGEQQAGALHALMERWRGTGDSVSTLPPDDARAVEVMAQLRAMGDAGPARQGASDYHAALSDAAVVIGDLRRGVQPRPGDVVGRQGGHLRHATDANGRAVGGAPGRRRRRRAGRP